MASKPPPSRVASAAAVSSAADASMVEMVVGASSVMGPSTRPLLCVMCLSEVKNLV